jgi:small subunit ribosomal protein S19
MSRSLKKGPFFKKNLIEKTKKYSIAKKCFRILPEYVGKIFNIYNGKQYIKIKIIDSQIGYKFGEFINTKKRCKHKKNK